MNTVCQWMMNVFMVLGYLRWGPLAPGSGRTTAGPVPDDHHPGRCTSAADVDPAPLTLIERPGRGRLEAVGVHRALGVDDLDHGRGGGEAELLGDANRGVVQEPVAPDEGAGGLELEHRDGDAGCVHAGCVHVCRISHPAGTCTGWEVNFWIRPRPRSPVQSPRSPRGRWTGSGHHGQLES
ncbi:hypothetical protein EB118_18220 [bacterium]|nr:hypothetical protein [bacterium]